MITALLGPTNTGKTHRAMERMLEHASGMIGLPLRLLAREVYDRVTAKVGEERVALVTGEEQRIPARPAYWIATVEAMPVERTVEFVAVDEVQLAAHDQRGHVFTSRILKARGTKETWLLGAGTMRPILRELVPTARQVEHPRLSRLGYAGATPLARVPERSAIVAFSMPHVYELAERMRMRRGGAAVVLGALSPRTRNAQVAMFQAGEVDWLIATDAIGMGLNLDVEHVAFAATRKFDGHDVREVDEAELAQIAGRAGRYVQDGTFGTITPIELPTSVAAAIETHRFPPVKRVRWRNDDLSFESIAALRQSLRVPPPRKILVPARDAEDSLALDRLGLREDVARAARGEEAVRLLWDVCTVPDFRKLLFEVHVDFLERLFLELAKRGRLDDDWIAGPIHDLERADGDVETLVARIAAIRTWTYVANRATWLDSPREWQEKTRAIEDRLSDALHERLVMRFVDAKKGGAKRARKRPKARPPSSRASSGRLPVDDERDDVSNGTAAAAHPFAQLAALRETLAAGPPPSAVVGYHGATSSALLARSAASSTSLSTAAWVELVVDAPHDALRLEADGKIVHLEAGRAFATIARGAALARPDARVIPGDELGAGAQQRLHRRALAFVRDVVGDLLGDLPALALAPPASSSIEAQAALRGLVHRLEQGVGTARMEDIEDVCAVLDAPAHAALHAAGLHLEGSIAWLDRGLTKEAITARIALASVWFGAARTPRPPSLEARSFAAPRRFEERAYAAIGFPRDGKRAVRADVFSGTGTDTGTGGERLGP